VTAHHIPAREDFGTSRRIAPESPLPWENQACLPGREQEVVKRLCTLMVVDRPWLWGQGDRLAMLLAMLWEGTTPVVLHVNAGCMGCEVWIWGCAQPSEPAFFMVCLPEQLTMAVRPRRGATENPTSPGAECRKLGFGPLTVSLGEGVSILVRLG
jgi:hypothetical protein